MHQAQRQVHEGLQRTVLAGAGGHPGEVGNAEPKKPKKRLRASSAEQLYGWDLLACVRADGHIVSPATKEWHARVHSEYARLSQVMREHYELLAEDSAFPAKQARAQRTREQAQWKASAELPQPGPQALPLPPPPQPPQPPLPPPPPLEPPTVGGLEVQPYQGAVAQPLARRIVLGPEVPAPFTPQPLAQLVSEQLPEAPISTQALEALLRHRGGTLRQVHTRFQAA